MLIDKELMDQIYAVASDVECGIEIDWTLVPRITDDGPNEVFCGVGELVSDLCNHSISTLSQKQRARLVIRLISVLNELHLTTTLEKGTDTQLAFAF